MVDLLNYLGKDVFVKIDRPIGSRHPKFEDIYYTINYGFIPNTVSGDGEEIDVYVLDFDKPLENCIVRVIGIINRLDDNENKLVGVVNTKAIYTDEEIMQKVDFVEKWFKSKLVR
ncbi:MAG: inorganic diphosphatase [Clostridia bacterium]|nr:inorganic diphosphatase [Clostridia bacterium]